MKSKYLKALMISVVVAAGSFSTAGMANQCGRQAGGKYCPVYQCCSQFGWCGTTPEYCSVAMGCQSQCKYDMVMPSSDALEDAESAIDFLGIGGID